jgi:hypothetical protein
MLLFFDISREGITWLTASAPLAAGFAAAERRGLSGLQDAAATCEVLVAWDAPRQRDAAAKRVPALARLQAVPLPPPRPEGGAAAVAAAYFAADGGLLPAGCRPSAEQWAVANAAARGLNVLCRAVAGAGKTTALLLCAARAPAHAHLLLTYNKRLQLEVGRRAGANVTALTYHAAAGRAYGGTVQNDEQLRRCVRSGAPEAPPRFDVLLVDEAQDMAVEYFALVRHLLAANPGARVIVVGDERQAINEYRGAHPGFLTEAPALYGAGAGAGADADEKGPARAWATCRLGVSYRLTPATAAFVNDCLYGAAVLTGGNGAVADRRPLYIAAAGKAGVTRALVASVRAAVAEFGPEGVFVLAPSVRGLASKASPVAELVRRLAGVPVYVGDGEGRAAPPLLHGKLAVLSYNAVKGCERPCAVLVGFDETYFRYYERAWEGPGLPNVLTVAATRASALLIVVAGARDTLRGLEPARLAATATLRGAPAPPRVRAVRARAARAPRPRATTIAAAVRHLHPETARAAAALVLTHQLADEAPRPAPPRAWVRFGEGGATEDLGFVYGALAPALAEVSRRGASAFAADLSRPRAGAAGAYPPRWWERVERARARPCTERTPAEWAVLAVARHAAREGHHHVARQVVHYDWVDAGALAAYGECVERALAGLEGDFEAPAAPAPLGAKTLHGTASFVEAKTGIAWEFKPDALCEEHELQLACYLALRGGGEGRLVSLTRRETRAVVLPADLAGEFLATVAARERAPVQAVSALVADFDAGLDAAVGPGAGPDADPGAGPDADGLGGSWSLDDAF